MARDQLRVASIIVGCFVLSSRCAFGAEKRNWVSITNDGCKPGIGLVLIEADGKVSGGKLYILDPKNPGMLTRGKGYHLTKLRHEGKTITADVSVIDGSSKTGTKRMHLRITLKTAFNRDKVEAVVQEGLGAGQAIVFLRQKAAKKRGEAK